MEGDKPIYIANATFPSVYGGCHRQIAVEIAEGVNAGVAITREDVGVTTLRVESAWYEDGMGENLKLVSSGGNYILRLSVCAFTRWLHRWANWDSHRLWRVYIQLRLFYR
jgi:hypothetical protein